MRRNQQSPVRPNHRTRNWRRSVEETYNFMLDIQRSQSTGEICEAFLGFARRFGASNILAGIIPPPAASSREQISHALLDAWPVEWSKRYFSSGYLYRDPAIRLVKEGRVPSFAWKDIESLDRIWTSGRQVMNEAGEFGLRDGVTLSFQTIERRQIGFSVAGEKIELPISEQIALHLAAASAFGQAVVLVEGSSERRAVSLSSRQRDVLRWASEGLTVNDIAERLSISSHTADSHLRAVRQKLGVRTSIQAVAEAFRLGLLN